MTGGIIFLDCLPACNFEILNSILSDCSYAIMAGCIFVNKILINRPSIVYNTVYQLNTVKLR